MRVAVIEGGSQADADWSRYRYRAFPVGFTVAFLSSLFIIWLNRNHRSWVLLSILTFAWSIPAILTEKAAEAIVRVGHKWDTGFDL